MMTNTAAYQFVTIRDPQTLAASVLAQAEQHALKGSVLVAEEGINLFLAGAAEQIGAFYTWLQAPIRGLRRCASSTAKASISRLRGSRSRSSGRSSVFGATMHRRCKVVRLR
ncbi:hypothetical protein XACB100_1160007 [Xanthomonas citri pv. citri]|nr:hypothetical protein XACB100_1160007 [Xanthomonas citri pv. citri]